MIRIDVARDDGEITRLNGRSGIAVCAPALEDQLQMSDPATVSLRCSTPEELAWNLATILATVKHVCPEAYETAHELMRFINPAHPRLQRKLPRYP